MSETHNEFHEVHGPINTGPGDQYIYLNTRESVREQARGPRLTLKGDLLWLKRRFVSPPNLGKASNVLDTTRTVLLTGPPGSGRRTAAKILLHRIADDHTPFTVLDDEAAGLQALADVKILNRHKLVLDLTDSTEGVFRARQRELNHFRTRLQQAQAHLVVVVPDSLQHHVDSELAKHIVRIDRPDGGEVLRAHLSAEQIDLPMRLLAATDVRRHLTASMAEIADLARLVVAASDESRDGNVETWLNEAISVRTERGGEVADQVQKHWRGRPRTVLLAAGMCRGASTDAVFFASHDLVKILALDEDEDPRLEQDGFRDQLRQMHIEVDADDRVEFGKFQYDQAVREYFWDNYPDLRRQFCQWVDHIIRDGLFAQRDRKNMVDRVVAESLRTKCPGHVSWLVERWLFPDQNRRPNPLWDFGVRALVRGLEDERHGSFFRRLVYEWSRRDDLSADVGQVLVDVCTEVIAPKYPSQALVRLHNRARREDGLGNPSARQAIADLIANNRLLLRLLLQRLVEAFDRDEQWPADVLLFLDLADPRLLSDTNGRRPLFVDGTVRPQLVFCWHTAMLARPDLVGQRVCDWLAAAGQVAPYDAVLGILVDAARHHLHLLGSLHVTARDWSHCAQGRPEVAAWLSQLIDRAQGLQTDDYVYPRTPEEVAR
ncbi:hypothetical protein GCM10011581_34110 [Saccharopolyspora subtropica]|uniref:Novel STAND NTPase 3 domain-containing protein n=1 Tax=Saccharopolyspora thermophila TaxID=89367 RepID=A0A917K1W4_9PSEU|nr:ATP-binding protein [Saccharopolyspora subtropica]GGI94165.1 hypothetical protein GCM10011581_34110 [Saccharopolyspora subtropica]